MSSQWPELLDVCYSELVRFQRAPKSYDIDSHIMNRACEQDEKNIYYADRDSC